MANNINIGATFTGTSEFVMVATAFNLINRSINNTVNLLTKGTAEALKFEQTIAEIQTISQKSASSFNHMASSVRALSNSFGVNVLQVAHATYEAISNQVVTGSNAVYFMAEALKFAQTTVSTVTQSVDLLTAAMNAYGLSSLHAADVASTFFAVIEVGRTTASQMGNVMGTAANLAAQMGVGLEDLGAGIAMLTSQGTLPNTALTLMSNIFLKLIKPSTEMTGLLKTWGFESGEAAVKTLGFSGVLQKLGQELETGGLARLADLAKDIRAIRGYSGLLNPGALGGFDDVKAQIEASKASYDPASEMIKDPGYYKYSQELERISNVLSTDFGRKAIEIFNELNTAFGGFSNQLKFAADAFHAIVTPAVNLITVLSQFGTVLGEVDALFGYSTGVMIQLAVVLAPIAAVTYAVTASLVGLSVALATAATTATGAAATFYALAAPIVAASAPVMVLVGALAAAATAVTYLTTVFSNFEQAALEKAIQEDIDLFKDLAAAAVETTKDLKKQVDEVVKRFGAVGAAINRALDRLSNRGNDNAENYLKSLNAQLEDTNRIISETDASFRLRDRTIVSYGQTFEQVTQELSNESDVLWNDLTNALNAPGWVQNADLIRDKFAQTRKEVEKLNDHLLKAIDKINKAGETAKERFANRQFDLSLGGGNQTQLIQAEIARLTASASQATSPDEAIRLMDRAEELAEKLTEIQNESNKSFAKLTGNTQLAIVAAKEENQVLQDRLTILNKLAAAKQAQLKDEKQLRDDRRVFDAEVKSSLEGEISREKMLQKLQADNNARMAEFTQLSETLFKKISTASEAKDIGLGKLNQDLRAAAQLNVISYPFGKEDDTWYSRRNAELTGDAKNLFTGNTIAEQAQSGNLLGALQELQIARENLNQVTNIDKDDAKRRQINAKIAVMEQTVRDMMASQENLPGLQLELQSLQTTGYTEMTQALNILQVKYPEEHKKFLDEMIKAKKSELEVIQEASRKLSLLGITNLQDIDKLGVGRAAGGFIGGNSYDGVNFRGSGGEFMLNRDVTNRIAPYLLALNSGRGASAAAGGAGGVYNEHITVNEAKTPYQTIGEIERSLRRRHRRGNNRLN